MTSKDKKTRQNGSKRKANGHGVNGSSGQDRIPEYVRIADEALGQPNAMEDPTPNYVFDEETNKVPEYTEYNGVSNGHTANGTANGSTDNAAKNATWSVPETFIRVSSLPVLKDSISTAHSIVTQHSLGRYALNQANITLDFVAKYATPYAAPLSQRFHTQLTKADELGCKSLDLIESKFPIVKQPTQDILDQISKPLTRVDAMRMDLKKRVDATVTVVTKPGYDMAYEVNKRAIHVVDNVEAVVNKYLPAKSENAQKAESTKDDQQVTQRVYHLTMSLPDRLGHRFSTTLQNTPRTREELTKLLETNDLLATSIASLSQLNDHLKLWLNNTAQQAQARLVPAHVSDRVHGLTSQVVQQYAETQAKASARIQELSQELLKELDAVSAYVRQHAPQLPPSIQQRLDPLVGFAEDEYALIRDQVLRQDQTAFQKAQNVVHLTQDKVLPVLWESVASVREEATYYRVFMGVQSEKVVNDVRGAFGVAVK